MHIFPHLVKKTNIHEFKYMFYLRNNSWQPYRFVLI